MGFTSASDDNGKKDGSTYCNIFDDDAKAKSSGTDQRVQLSFLSRSLLTIVSLQHFQDGIRHIHRSLIRILVNQIGRHILLLDPDIRFRLRRHGRRCMTGFLRMKLGSRMGDGRCECPPTKSLERKSMNAW